MSTLNNSLLLGAPASGGYQIQRSLRFNSSDSAFCARTPSSAGNRKTFTFAAWVKRARVPNVYNESYFFSCIFSPNNSDSNYFRFGFAGDRLFCGLYGTGVSSAAVYRDYSAWYHVVLAVDTTQATASNRIRLYVNGSEITAFNSASYPAQNTDLAVNSTNAHHLGYTPDPTYGHDGYLADVHLIDGQQLTPSSFTEVSATTGQLVPKQYTGSFGTNGFWLKFSDNSAATATTLGKDYSGNNNNWSCNNLQVTSKDYTSMVTCGGGFRPAFPKSNLFDGSLATGAETQTVEGVGSGVGVFTPSPSIAYTSSVEVYGGEVGQDEARINGGSWVSVNGGWLTLATGSGTINTIEWRDRRGDGTGGSLNAIRVDGVQLVDVPSSGVDSLVDTPTSAGTDTGLGGQVIGNYATLNPLDKASAFTLENGNLQGKSTSSFKSVRATIGMPTGKWYWEHTIETTNDMTGIQPAGAYLDSHIGTSGVGDSGVALGNTTIYNQGSSSSAGGATSNGAVVSVAFDADGGKLWFRVNGGSWLSGDPAAGTSPSVSGLTGKTYFPAVTGYNNSTGMYLNFGQRPFAYTAPSGFKALCDTNLPAPVVAKSSDYFQTVLYTGNGGTQTISGLGFSPDFIWTKSRSRIDNNVLHDIVRGRTSNLYSDLAASENTTTTSTADLVSFDANGYTLGTVQQSAMNRSGETYVAWTWDAGTSTVTNTQGSITSQVRANPSAGFSIVTFTGGGAGSTIGHGLGVAPQLIIVKDRGVSSDWCVYHVSTGGGNFTKLNSTSASAADTTMWGNTTPSSTTFTWGYGSGSNYVAYCFAPVAGYSSFGSYTGNGSADGPFVYTGFRPRWILTKCSSSGGSGQNWFILDTARNTYNPVGQWLRPNLSDSETTYNSHDILSNGFKVRDTDNALNGSGQTYVWAAFAESPFAYSRAR